MQCLIKNCVCGASGKCINSRRTSNVLEEVDVANILVVKNRFKVLTVQAHGKCSKLAVKESNCYCLRGEKHSGKSNINELVCVVSVVDKQEQ